MCDTWYSGLRCDNGQIHPTSHASRSSIVERNGLSVFPFRCLFAEVEKKISFEAGQLVEGNVQIRSVCGGCGYMCGWVAAEGMSDGSFAGMIVAWVIGFPIVLALIAVPVYIKLVRAQ